MKSNNTFQIKDVAHISKVSARTLQYYDEIGLLPARRDPQSHYQLYDEHDLLRLQQIMFYKQAGFNLEQVAAILDDPRFDLATALRQHRAVLRQQVARLYEQIETINSTLAHIKGDQHMAPENYFKGYDPTRQKEYEEEIRQKYGDSTELRQSVQRWNACTKEQKQKIGIEGEAIMERLAALIDKGFADPAVQEQIAAWHRHLFYFYDCSLEVFEGLGRLYNEDDRFRAGFEARHPGFAGFMLKAMQFYTEQQRL